VHSLLLPVTGIPEDQVPTQLLQSLNRHSSITNPNQGLAAAAPHAPTAAAAALRGPGGGDEASDSPGESGSTDTTARQEQRGSSATAATGTLPERHSFDVTPPPMSRWMQATYSSVSAPDGSADGGLVLQSSTELGVRSLSEPGPANVVMVAPGAAGAAGDGGVVRGGTADVQPGSSMRAAAVKEREDEMTARSTADISDTLAALLPP
jgi:hypothetical protein